MLGKFTDLNEFSGESFGRKCSNFHCNVDGIYKLYNSYGETANLQLVAGISYEYPVKNIKTSSGGTVPSGSIILFW